MPNLVSLTHPSIQMLNKTQTGVFQISRFLVKSLINKNCQNPGTNNDIGMKLGPVTKLGKRKTSTKFDDNVVSVNYYLIIFSELWLTWRNPEPKFQTHGL